MAVKKKKRLSSKLNLKKIVDLKELPKKTSTVFKIANQITKDNWDLHLTQLLSYVLINSDVLAKKTKVDEDNIKVDSTSLNNMIVKLYDLLSKKKNFTLYFTDDGLIQLKSLIDNYNVSAIKARLALLVN